MLSLARSKTYSEGADSTEGPGRGGGYTFGLRIPRTSSTPVRSARNGQRSMSSVSCGSLNQDETGTALCGWKMYDAGELSRMMVSETGRPSWERSCCARCYLVFRELDVLRKAREGQRKRRHNTDLNIIPPMIITTLPKQPMRHNTLRRIQPIQHGICVFRETGGEDDDLVQLAHLAEEGVDAGAFEDVEVVPVVLDLDGDDVVGCGDGLWRANVKHQ